MKEETSQFALIEFDPNVGLIFYRLVDGKRIKTHRSYIHNIKKSSFNDLMHCLSHNVFFDLPGLVYMFKDYLYTEENSDSPPKTHDEPLS